MKVDFGQCLMIVDRVIPLEFINFQFPLFNCMYISNEIACTGIFLDSIGQY